MTKTREKLHFPFFRKIAPPLFISCIIFQRTQSSRSRFFYSFLIFFGQNCLSLVRFTWFAFLLFVLVFCDLFVRNCLGLERQTCFSPQALAALAPPKPGFGSHGSCLRQPANPWTCQQNPKLAPICLSQLGNLRSKTIVYIQSVSAHHDLGWEGKTFSL